MQLQQCLAGEQACTSPTHHPSSVLHLPPSAGRSAQPGLARLLGWGALHLGEVEKGWKVEQDETLLA